MSTQSGNPATCRNCGRSAGPRHCGHCGQALVERQGPFWQMLGELLSDALSLDSQLVRSLRALLLPGRLTRLWVDGKRAPYLRPFRLYLLASVAVFSTVLALDKVDATRYDIYIGDELVSAQSSGDRKAVLQFLDADSAFGRWFSVRFGDRIERLRALPPQEIVDTVVSSAQAAAPLGLIAAFPFLALALKLLYWRSRVLYVEHLVFALHVQSALLFTLAGAWLVARLLALEPLTSVGFYLAVWLSVMIVYQGVALRRFYGQSWWWTVTKVVPIGVAYLYALGFVVSWAISFAVWKV